VDPKYWVLALERSISNAFFRDRPAHRNWHSRAVDVLAAARTTNGGLINSEWRKHPQTRVLRIVASEVKGGRMTPKIGTVFDLDAIVEAHRRMEENAAGGKIVVLT